MYDIAMIQNDNNVTAIRTKVSLLRCFKIYFNITFFKGSPEQLPLSWSCAAKALLVYCAINLWLLDTHSSTFDVLFKIIIEIALLVVFLKLGLKATNKPERFAQTMSALMGIGMVISLISVPIYYLLIPQFLQQQEVTQSVINITLLLLVWNLAVISHIFKRSLEISTLMSAVIAFNYLIVFEVIIISLATGATPT